MKKLLLTGASLLTLAVGQQANAQAWSQNFNSATLPSGWSTISDGKTPATGLSANLQAKLAANGWAVVTRTAATGDSCVVSTSWFTPVGQADRWLISQSFQVTSPNMVLSWEDYAPDATYTDMMQIMVSPSAGTTTGAFTTSIYNQKGSTTGFVKHGVSLGAYNGQTIRVAFRNNSNDLFLLYMDNAATAVLPATDASMSNLTPSVTSPVAYGTVGSNVTLAATVTNNGASNLTSFVVNYQQGSGAVVSQTITGVNVGPYSSTNFTFSTPFNIASAAAYPIKAWVTATGDVNHTNDTATTTVTGVTFMPKKKLLIEEATGTWCGWCVRGIVYMDSLWKTNANDVSLVAVHNADPMVVPAYDTWIGTKISGYPSVVVDRRETADPLDLFGSGGQNIYNNEKNYFGFADINLGNITYTGNNFSLPVSVTPALALSGDYRLVLVLTEDAVHGTTSHTDVGGTAVAYDMHNYYSSGSQNLPLTGGGVNYQTSPVYIPASQMYYNFVGRAVIPSVTGAAGSLPATMTAGSNYSYTFTGTVDPSWTKNKLRGVVMMLRNSDGTVLNSNNSRWSLGVNNVTAGVSNVSVYPNPATEVATARFELSQSTSVSVDVLDITGRVVSSVPASQMAAGEHMVTIPVSNLATGLYNVKITTAQGTTTERLSVVK